MSDRPEDPRQEPAAEEHTRRIDRPPRSGASQPGQGPPPPAPPYGTGGHGYPGAYEPSGPFQPGQGHPSPAAPPYGAGGHDHPQAGQGYPPPAPPYGTGGHGYQGAPPYGPGGHGYPGAYQPPGPYGGYGPPPGYGRPPGYGHPAPPGTYGPRPGSDDTTMATLAHLLGLLTWFIGPLVLYLVKKDESPYVRDQAAEALNFQLTLVIAYVVSWILAFMLIGFLLMPVVWIGSIVFMIIAAVAANRGENYRYPLSIRFLR
ncbi:DUF4870 domain-containing protein [Streptosporangium sp. NBC_01639]|uniref:DUF4870 domain-containing protein n=1 Tax=Streptosporangium sp. NBC_01639 TaxID=2975948 RepID=UPI0038690A2E|nr:DUF4870 domain-containing protein [Streptosporangium sp. NBC_01639]